MGRSEKWLNTKWGYVVWLPVAVIAVLSVTAETQPFKEAFEQGEANFQARDYIAAIAQFKEADTLRATPEVAYDLAKCYEKLGERAYTAYYYRLYLRRAPQATDAMEIAERVGLIVSAMEADGQGLLELEAPGAQAVILLGERLTELPLVRFLAPGDYELEVQFPQGSQNASVQLLTGKITNLSLLPTRPRLTPRESMATSVPTILESTQPTVSPWRWGSYAVAGLGLAALATAVALGASSAQDVAAAQDKSLMFSQAQQLATSANEKGLAANVLFGAGGAAIAGGIVMFIFSSPAPSAAPMSAGATP